MGHFFTYGFLMIIDLVFVAVLQRKFATDSLIAGLSCGIVSGYSALTVFHYFSKMIGSVNETLLIFSIGLPLTGMMLFFVRSLLHANYTSWLDRFHQMGTSVIKRHQFECNKTYFESAFPDEIGLDSDPIGHSAYRRTQQYMLKMTAFGFLGVGLGIYLAW